MRLRIGAVLCLFIAFWGAGCRKAVAPVVDNQAPETWIVSAPQDTITTRDELNQPVRPGIGRIPVRFHLYWAGSDRDGQVAGYYYAVVETLPIPPEGAIAVPNLPGPKASEYRFTTRTDSIFVFRASEEVSERQHAFYIYAVDNKGRPDPTPARFIFSSYDRFPPLAIIEELRADATIFTLNPGGVATPVTRTYTVRDSFEVGNENHIAPRDTVPSSAVLNMRWRGEITSPTGAVTGYRYKLDESSFNNADSSVRSATYNTGVGVDRVTPGQKIFTLRALGESGWRGESTRWFQMNFAPDTWFAGPDPSNLASGWQTVVRSGKTYYFKRVAPGGGWGVTGTQLSGDSLSLLPHQRTPFRSFFEIFGDTLWLRQEGDTVNMNSFVVFPAGGFDKDSPYAIKVIPSPADSLALGQPLTTPGPANGSPIGFRLQVRVKPGTLASNRVDASSESFTYPRFEPGTFRNPVVNGYAVMNLSGKAYAAVRAQDGDGAADRTLDAGGGYPTIADNVDAGGGTAAERALRSKILTFFVNRPPQLNRAAGSGFVPAANANVTNRTVTGWNMPAVDPDGYDPDRVPAPGYSSTTSPLRRKLAILGKLAGSGGTRDTCYVVPTVFSAANNISFVIPSYIATGPITLRIRLCDCKECDDLDWPAVCGREVNIAEPRPSTGRCVETTIPLNLTAAEPAAIVGPDAVTQRPGSSSEGRRQ